MGVATLPQQTTLMSGEEFLQRHGDERGIELVRGVVRRKAMPGARHGQVCFRLATKLGLYLEKNDLGHVFTHDTFVITETSPVSYRGPDFQFIGYKKIPKGEVPIGIPDVPPDLVIEVRSPSDSWRSMTAKAVEYLNADVCVVVLIDPSDQSATIFRSDEKPQTIHAEGSMTIPDLLPGFSLPLASLFE